MIVHSFADYYITAATQNQVRRCSNLFNVSRIPRNSSRRSCCPFCSACRCSFLRSSKSASSLWCHGYRTKTWKPKADEAITKLVREKPRVISMAMFCKVLLVRLSQGLVSGLYCRISYLNWKSDNYGTNPVIEFFQIVVNRTNTSSSKEYLKSLPRMTCWLRQDAKMYSVRCLRTVRLMLSLLHFTYPAQIDGKEQKAWINQKTIELKYTNAKILRCFLVARLQREITPQYSQIMRSQALSPGTIVGLLCFGQH